MAGEGDAQEPRAALPAATDRGIEALRAVALPGVTGTITVDVSEDPPEEGKDGEPTYTVVVTAGTDREEYPHLPLKGRSNVATKINSASKLIKIVDTGVSLPETRHSRGHLHARHTAAVGGARRCRSLRR